MIKNYLTIAVRNLARQKGYAFVNLAGLAVGLACCLMIMLFVRHELSYDRFHADADRIYRVLREDSAGTGLRYTPTVLGNLAPAFEANIVGVEASVRMHRKAAVLGANGTFLKQDGFYWSDPSVFDVFNFTLERGDVASALTRPGTAVVTQAVARRFFGDADAVGQTLLLDGEKNLEITGIVNPPPTNSDLQFEVIASMSTIGELENPWESVNQGWSFVRLADGQTAAAVTGRIQDKIRELAWWWNHEAIHVAYVLQPLTDVHLHSKGMMGTGADVGDIRYVYLFSAIAALILVIASINYMNLATARAIRRAREVGMRKALGAHRGQLVGQFMSESVFLCLLGFIGAVAIVAVTLPAFNTVTGRELTLTMRNDGVLLAAFLGVACFTGLAAGIYPAAVLSRFSPVRVLKGLRDSTGGPNLRRGLVVLQFGISILLLVGTAVIYQQMRYIQTTNLGFDNDQVILVRTRGLDGGATTFMQALHEIPGVVSTSGTSGIPILQGGWVSESEIGSEKLMTMRVLVDADYLQTMGMTLVAGRDYLADSESDLTQSLLVNETMVAVRGWEDPLSETLPSGSDSDGNPVMANVVGVVADFHTGSLHEAIMPTVLDANPRWDPYKGAVVIRFHPENLTETLTSIEATWARFVPNTPLDFRFVDDAVEALYRAEQQFGRLFATFTLLAVLVACLGLFGLAAYVTEQRTKEIGIRKVLGASVGGIIVLLSKEFVRLIVVAFVIAAPVGYLLMQRWLDDFAYRVSISWSLFVVVGVVASAAALLTVAYQAVRAAVADPVKSLRYE